MSKSRSDYDSYDTDYGRHVTALRARARRPDPKSRKGRAADKRQAIERSRKDS